MLLSCEYVWTVIPTELQSAEQGRNLAFCVGLGLKTRIDLPMYECARTPTPVDATPKAKI